MYTILKISKGNIVVWSFQNQKQRSTSLSLRSAGLWTTLTPFHMAIIRFLFIQRFIYTDVYLLEYLFIQIFIY